MTKNSLKTGPDELGYYGEGDAAMGGMAVGVSRLRLAAPPPQDAVESQGRDRVGAVLYACNMLVRLGSPLGPSQAFS